MKIKIVIFRYSFLFIKTYKLMKAFKILCTVFAIIFLLSCNKDTIPGISKSSSLNKSSFNVNSKWSPIEAKFFNLNGTPKPNEILSENRTRSNFTFHPLVVDLYNYLDNRNENFHFIGNIVNKVGLPYWREAQIFDNRITNTNLVILPMAFPTERKTSGLIVATKVQNIFIVNDISRQKLISMPNLEIKRHYMPYIRAILDYDKKIFRVEDQALINKYCEILNDQQGLTSNGDPLPCIWKLIEVCHHNETQTWWIGGSSKIPLHLDHDRDGILNEDDQDWHELTRRFSGLTQVSFEFLIRDFFEENYPELQYDDINWSDFFNSFTDGTEIDFNITYDPNFWGDWWSEFLDTFDIPGNEGYGCNDLDNPFQGGITVDNRTLNCNKYYVKDCGFNGEVQDWTNLFTEVIPCPTCTGQEMDFWEQELYYHFRNYLDYTYQNQDLFNFLWPFMLDCPAIVGENIAWACFEDKIDEIMLGKFEAYLNQYPFANINTNVLYTPQTLLASNIISPYCLLENNFNNCAMEAIIKNFETQNGSGGQGTSGFTDRTLSCESFWFYPQQNGAGQIACVDNLYLSKSLLPGIQANTDPFCISFTLPAIRYTGEVISKGKASDCAAWSANAAATVCGLFYAQQVTAGNASITDESLIKLFKVSFNLKAKLSSCGYGSATDCNATTCIGATRNAKWDAGFFEWLLEQFFGCE